MKDTLLTINLIIHWPAESPQMWTIPFCGKLYSIWCHVAQPPARRINTLVCFCPRNGAVPRYWCALLQLSVFRFRSRIQNRARGSKKRSWKASIFVWFAELPLTHFISVDTRSAICSPHNMLFVAMGVGKAGHTHTHSHIANTTHPF